MHFPSSFPVLKIDKYILRETRESDAEFYFNCLTDPEIIINTSYNVRNISEIKKWFQNYKDEFKNSKRISWVIENTENNEAIGEISLFDVSIDHDKAEIGYFLDKNYWGKGIMSLILAKILEYLFEELAINRIQACFVEENKASHRLLEKNGFEKEGVLKDYKKCRGGYKDFVLFSKIFD